MAELVDTYAVEEVFRSQEDAIGAAQVLAKKDARFLTSITTDDDETCYCLRVSARNTDKGHEGELIELRTTSIGGYVLGLLDGWRIAAEGS